MKKAWHWFEPTLRLVAATVLIGAVLGGVIGGIGGRIAMRILFLTSGDAVKGMISDDGFRIGRFTLADTLGLIGLTAVVGVFAALLFLLARPFIAPLRRRRIPAMAAFYGVIGGAMLVHRGGVDFVRLHPAALAIGLFVVISAGFGAAAGSLIGRAAGDRAWPQRAPWWLLGLPLAATLFPFLLPLAVIAALLNRWSEVARDDDWRWRYMHASAVAAMALLFALGAVDLTIDAAHLV